MNTNLKDINFGFNTFCGPSVMSALTGKSTDECAAVISAVSGRQEIRAVSTAHLIEAFRRLRFDMKQIDKMGYSLFSNLSYLSRSDGMYIVMVPKHVVAIEVRENQIWLVDNHSKQPVDASASARLTQKCEAVYKIIERPRPIFIETIIRVINNYDSYISIEAIDRYENADDVRRNLGRFTFKDRNELTKIVKEFQQFTQVGEK
jgi:hypothetical protein